MLNAKKERELAYVVKVDAIEPIEGKDRVEAAVVGGWKTMVRKGVFEPGDLGIYIEIDSKVPEKAPFEFLSKYHYKVKTQKFKQFYSQGLLMSPSDFGWTVDSAQFAGGFLFVKDKEGNAHIPGEENMFLTKQLGITYATASDNRRKAPSVDKYKKMAQRHPELFKKDWARWMMKREWGKKVMFLFFGKAKDKRGGWPSWVVKTDEERIENLPYLFEEKVPWIATEKIDGSSTTFTLKRGKFGKKEYFVCSRNVCFDTPAKAEKCYYDSNIYLEMSEKYHIKDVLTAIMQSMPDLDYVTLQGETYGDGVQKRTYGLTNKEHRLMAFNLIYGFKNGFNRRLNPCEMTNVLTKYGVPCVPIITEYYVLPDTLEELRNYVNNRPSDLDGEIKEGIVFRSRDGVRSFKCVSPEFLLKYHG